MKIFITCLLLFIATFFSKVVNATIINDIKIDNNNRISKETIITYGKIKLNKDYSKCYSRGYQVKNYDRSNIRKSFF